MYNHEEDAIGGPFQRGQSMLMGNPLNEGNYHNRGLDSSSGYREFKTQRSFKPQATTAARLSKFSNSVAGSSQFDFSRDTNRVNGAGYEEINDADSSNHLLLGRPNSPNKNNGHVPFRENTRVSSYSNLFLCFLHFVILGREIVGAMGDIPSVRDF